MSDFEGWFAGLFSAQESANRIYNSAKEVEELEEDFMFVRITSGLCCGKIVEGSVGDYMEGSLLTGMSDVYCESVYSPGYKSPSIHVFVKSLIDTDVLEKGWDYLVEGNMWGDEDVSVHTPHGVLTFNREIFELVGGNILTMRSGDRGFSIFNHGGGDYLTCDDGADKAQVAINKKLAKLMITALTMYVEKD